MLALLEAYPVRKACLYGTIAVGTALVAYKVIRRQIGQAELRAKIRRRQIDREQCFERLRAKLEIADQDHLTEILKLDTDSLIRKFFIKKSNV